MVSERGLEVLRVIVHDYVASREPVGSKSIVERHQFGVSAATIRNDMALLEEEELITAPHTSSGRVPTDKGYRLFVNELADLRPLTSAQRQAIETFLGDSTDLDEVLGRTVRLLSQLTNQVALVQYPSFSRARVRHIELVSLGETRVMTVLITDSGQVEQRLIDLPTPVDEVFLSELRASVNAVVGGAALSDAARSLSDLPERFRPDLAAIVRRVVASLVEQLAAGRQDRLVMSGAANLVRTGDDFSGNLYPVLEAIEEQVALLRLFGEMQLDAVDVVASIGRENASFGLAQTSVLASGYTSSGSEIARIGVLGPLRMDYSSNMAAVRAVARYLSSTLAER
ncbi:heat-inducible transcriptional repressor HrcA [Frigoribacterium sp. CFBP9039]|uniref:heat-inducible transcriptional repressor HrcA n=1 Tax=Frigoribacterium TaxID=96492 RepID=UPI00177E0076|nr:MULTISPECIES: heat-inducible transcriptional repressor HrcA [Frigoribacterium]MBD8702174.1 heat-inducible transcriptional repressor HrcA [Frigoribacterium sp. CFBP 13712]MCJ0701965.1 heat-inducible transcriptional repressor HrcA [Frigoribacterium faeni]MDY0892996.1 heat-inducible transcriptional repressor HrcA [Frigoribacterium sp. CFBP9030]MDY0946404.1 heat-inducible transcriptional repressor HrcA [Frigoribacterium sp. CFBP9039]